MGVFENYKSLEQLFILYHSVRRRAHCCLFNHFDNPYIDEWNLLEGHKIQETIH